MNRTKIFVCAAAAVCILAPLTAVAKSKPAKAAKAAAPAPGKTEVERAQESFGSFCELWMEKLAARERDNLLRLEWKTNGNGFNATYVGYSKEHDCNVTNAGKVPIGRVLYKEVTYQQEGSTLEEAKSSAPRPIEIYEVTELFRFNKGKWSTD